MSDLWQRRFAPQGARVFGLPAALQSLSAPDLRRVSGAQKLYSQPRPHGVQKLLAKNAITGTVHRVRSQETPARQYLHGLLV